MVFDQGELSKLEDSSRRLRQRSTTGNSKCGRRNRKYSYLSRTKTGSKLQRQIWGFRPRRFEETVSWRPRQRPTSGNDNIHFETRINIFGCRAWSQPVAPLFRARPWSKTTALSDYVTKILYTSSRIFGSLSMFSTFVTKRHNILHLTQVAIKHSL